MSLTNLGLNPDPLVRTLFTLFLCFENFVVGVFGSDVFSPIGVESRGGIFTSVVFVPTVVYFKGGQLHAFFWRSNSLFYFQISKPALQL